jgi:hypothetical protein
MTNPENILAFWFPPGLDADQAARSRQFQFWFGGGANVRDCTATRGCRPMSGCSKPALRRSSVVSPRPTVLGELLEKVERNGGRPSSSLSDHIFGSAERIPDAFLGCLDDRGEHRA